MVEAEPHRRRISLMRAWQSVLRLPFVLGRLLLELLPVVVFVGVATALLGTGIAATSTTRLVILAVVNAYAASRVLICAVHTLIGPFGFVGASLYISLTSLGCAVIMLILAQKVMTVPFRKVLWVQTTPLPGMIVATAVTFLLEHYVLRSDTHGVILAVALLTVDTIVFCLVYLAVLFVFARSSALKIIRVVPAVLGRFRPATGPA